MTKHILLLSFFVLYGPVRQQAQCPPPGAPAAEHDCSSVNLFCDLDGYCNTLSAINNPQLIQGCPPGFVFNNPDWFGFIAGSALIEFEIVPSNCQSSPTQGLQGGLFVNCPTGPIDLQCPCTTSPFLLSSDLFTIGNTYFLAVDGCAANICDYQINILQGAILPYPLEPITGDVSVCEGTTTTYSVAESPLTTYTWTLTPPGIGDLVGPNPNDSITVVWNTEGVGQLCVTATTAGGCPSQTNCLDVHSGEVITWLGAIDWWDVPSHWDLGYVPRFCNHIIVPTGFPTVPAGVDAVGRTLCVMLGAELDVSIGATMDIR